MDSSDMLSLALDRSCDILMTQLYTCILSNNTSILNFIRDVVTSLIREPVKLLANLSLCTLTICTRFSVIYSNNLLERNEK